MRKAVMVMMNTRGKTRLVKFYEYLLAEKQQEIIRCVFAVLCSRVENVNNFMDAESVFGPVHTILDEVVFGGQVVETSSSEIMKAVEEISKVRSCLKCYHTHSKTCFWLAK
ncbi:hypothetical protein GQ457_05G006520 [Hibiscus cannabinus]